MKLLFSILLTVVILFAVGAKAAPIIRDTELETSIRTLANPIFKAAGLKSEDVRIYIVNNNEINAYVTGGKNIFIHTGLLSLAKDPNMLVGVIAHETGHIYGGHLLKGEEEAKNSVVKATFGYMLGLAAAAAGSPQAGAAIASGTQQVVTRQVLKNSRNNENAADHSALNFLDKSGVSSKGILDMMEVLYGKEVTMYGEINPYTQTHPLSRERIDHVRAHYNGSPIAAKLLNPDVTAIYTRAIIKLDAFLQAPDKTLKKFPVSDTSVNARYARAIAYYRVPKLAQALTEIDALIKEFPSDPYFIELKAQILFENGKVADSVAAYQRAKDLLPGSSLFKIQLATAQVATEDEALLKNAVSNLEQAIRVEKLNSFAWHQLGIAYGRMGKLDMSNLALAEEAMIIGDKDEAKRFIKIARQSATPGSPTDLRLKDMESNINDGKKSKKD